jgi:hypothetical protein
MYVVHIMNQVHHFFNVIKKSNLLVIVAGESAHIGMLFNYVKFFIQSNPIPPYGVDLIQFYLVESTEQIG